MKKLKRTRQCMKCPWKKSTNPYEIPHGYCAVKHANLKNTIADPETNVLDVLEGKSIFRSMACHESEPGDEAYCIGWLAHQLGRGNNILLRLMMREYDFSDVRLDGEQHERFEDTLPPCSTLGHDGGSA